MEAKCCKIAFLGVITQKGTDKIRPPEQSVTRQVHSNVVNHSEPDSKAGLLMAKHRSLLKNEAGVSQSGSAIITQCKLPPKNTKLLMPHYCAWPLSHPLEAVLLFPLNFWPLNNAKRPQIPENPNQVNAANPS